MYLLTNLVLALGCLASGQSSVPPGQRDPKAEGAPARGGSSVSEPVGAGASAPAQSGAREFERWYPWFVILNAPQDLDELWRKIERPDLVLLKGDRLENFGGRKPVAGRGGQASRALVESVKISGRVVGESADLVIELTVASSGAGAVWVPIRLDNQRLVAAREKGRDLDLRQQERGEWLVQLTGEGEHGIRIELRAGIINELARRRLSFAIPEAQSTRLELDLGGRGSDIVIGANEDFGQNEPGRDKAKPLTAHLSPRSKLEVSWLEEAEPGRGAAPILTAQGEIAIEIDAQQVRMRSSWSIRCIRGTARNVELAVGDEDEITEVELDDQSMDEDIAQGRGRGKLLIPLVDPLRAGGSARLVLRTRRPLAKSGARRISFAGFPFAAAREQTGYIGITKSPNIWVGSAAPRGLHRIDASKLPSDLRARPGTSLAYEFLDQPFMLDLAVENAPAQIRGETRTFLEVDPGRVRSETTIDLTWLGEVFELEVGVAPGLQDISVGPRESVESWHALLESSGAGEAAAKTQGRRLNIRLSPQARDSNKVVLKLTAVEAIEAAGSIKLGLFSFDRAIPVNAFYAVAAGRGLALDVEDDSGRLRSSPELKSRFQNLSGTWPGVFLPREEQSRQLFLADRGGSSYLPIRVTRPKRVVRHETVLSAKVSSRSVEVIERTTISVRHGDVRSVVIRVPAEFAARWELLDRQEIDSQELGREADGSRRYRLTFERAVVDQAVVRFRYRLPLVKELDALTARDVTIDRITIEEGEAAPVQVELELDPEIVVENWTPPGWARAAGDQRGEPAGERPLAQFAEEDASRRGGAFTFKARALSHVALPPLVIPRLLIKTVQGVDGSRRTTARYWVELHGNEFPFELPSGLEWIEARVDGRITDQVDYDQSTSRHSLRLKSDSASRPVLVELEFQEPGANPGASFRLPKLLGGAVVLQALWEARLPWSLAVVGIPRGWSEENHWSFSGLTWKRRPVKDTAGLNEWLVGNGGATLAMDDFTGSGAFDEDRYLFSRRGEPVALDLWLVPGSWLVGICSGLSLVIGFLAIFRKLQFRTIWLLIAGACVLSATLVEPSVTVLGLQAALLGALLSLVGFVIERSIERARKRLLPSGRAGAPAARPLSDSPLKGTAVVGSDDPTAIRVRVPSTVDHAPAPDVGQEAIPEGRSSTVQRA